MEIKHTEGINVFYTNYVNSLFHNKMFYLIIHETVEEEDEHPLKYIEDGEDVGKDDHISVDVRQSKHPGDTQETQENQRPSQPGPMER